MGYPLIRRAGFAAAISVLLTPLPAPLAAQRGAAAPTNVTVVGTGSSATVTWTPVERRGVTYRVLRADQVKETGVDITRPVEVAPVVDPKVEPGRTYFYQVIAVYPDGATTAAAPVGFTVPAPALGGEAIRAAQPIIRMAPRSPPPPTAVTGVAVTGTTASATVSWQPTTGAVSYTVTRSTPDGFAPKTFTGLTTVSWKDDGPGGIGFVVAGTYGYQVTAILPDGSSVSGQANWTRPNPTCAAPLPNQPMLTVLDPTGQGSSQFTQYGPLPNGGAFSWVGQKNSGIIAYRVERSVQGSNTWVLVGTTCGGGSVPIASSTTGTVTSARMVDSLLGAVPNTSYLYRLTALAANGEAGAATIPWTAPSLVVPRWLAATAAANTVTLKWRFEPPATNPPALPTAFRITAPYGLNVVSPGPCTGLAGCSRWLNAVPAGTHKFTVTALWALYGPNGPSGPVVARASADTTIVIP